MRPDGLLYHAKHVLRVGIALVVVIVALFLGRSLFVPPSFGEYGPYRATSVVEHRGLPVRHGGDAACGDCHEQSETKAAGGHATVACESCHGPLAGHVADGELVAPMPVPETVEKCLLCHRRLAARPDDFPQVDPTAHVEEMGGEPGERACFDCHDPHAPL